MKGGDLCCSISSKDRNSPTLIITLIRGPPARNALTFMSHTNTSPAMQDLREA